MKKQNTKNHITKNVCTILGTLLFALPIQGMHTPRIGTPRTHHLYTNRSVFTFQQDHTADTDSEDIDLDMPHLEDVGDSGDDGEDEIRDSGSDTEVDVDEWLSRRHAEQAQEAETPSELEWVNV